MSPVQGLVRLRKHQWGRQAAHGTAVAATRAYNWAGVPDVDLAWTHPEGDLGSIDPVAAPIRGIPTLGWTETTDALTYNDLVRVLSAFFGGGEAPSGAGTAQTWTHEPASETIDEPDVYTGEFGDDVTDDWYQFRDCILESFDLSAENKGPLSASITWRMGKVASTGSTDHPVSGTVPTPALTVPKNDAIMYLKDGAVYVADATSGLAAGKLERAWHSFELHGEHEIDDKRWADGDQSYDVDDYAPGARILRFTGTFAKTADIVGTGSEADHWLSEQAVDRYLRMIFTSKVLAESPSTYHRWTVTLPIRYMTREEAEIGGNSVVVLAGEAWYDPDDLGGVLTSEVVCTLDESDLGIIGS
jgi:hypothetical protein